MPVEVCPCSSGRIFNECCNQYIKGIRYADTAEQLMRSRYTAFTLQDEKYLLSTWHSSTRPASLQLEQMEMMRWVSLQVLSSVMSNTDANEAEVEFIARYKVNGKAGKLHETSRFKRQGQQWFYLDGLIHN